MYLCSPQAAEKTTFLSTHGQFNHTGTWSGLFNASTSFTGITFFQTADVISGTLQIYGIRD
jgi:hypothetical protein